MPTDNRISESIPSYKGAALNQAKIQESGGLEESIPESIVASGEVAATKNKSATHDSIIEDDVQERTESIPSASIADDVPDEAITRAEEISEASYLRDSAVSIE